MYDCGTKASKAGQADLPASLSQTRAYRRFRHLDIRRLDPQPVMDPVRLRDLVLMAI
jgi:hypothetical protein